MTPDGHAHPFRACRLSFDDLAHWPPTLTDGVAAYACFLESASVLQGTAWQDALAGLAASADLVAGFEAQFQPVLVGDEPGLLTGYYEPELDASTVRSDAFSCPIYRLPDDCPPMGPWLSRAQIARGEGVAGKGYEIAWLRDAVEAFFLQVQGSGRLRFQDGRRLRVGFAGKNGHAYRSIGAEMVARGLLPPEGVTADAIKAWLRAHPDKQANVLSLNPSFVFFRALDGLGDAAGPLGTAGTALHAHHSLAVDPAHIALGTPVWVESQGPTPIFRLMTAQDTGSAIQGAQRGDVFFGTGDAAGQITGRFVQPARLVQFWPRADARLQGLPA